MRFSEERIRQLSKQIAKDLVDKGAVDKSVKPDNLATLVAHVMIKDFQVEDAIDEEVRAHLEKMPRLPPPGSGEYEATFERIKREVAARKGWPL